MLPGRRRLRQQLGSGLPTSNGLMLLLSQQSGELVAVLHDEGLLTDIRTAVAGAIAARYVAPSNVSRIGIAGTGIQARLQLGYLAPVTECREVLAWGRNPDHVAQYVTDMAPLGVNVALAADSAELLDSC